MELNCKIVNDYFTCLTVIKARSTHTFSEYCVDLHMLFMFTYEQRKLGASTPQDCSFADAEFIKSITIDDIYAFIAYCQN